MTPGAVDSTPPPSGAGVLLDRLDGLKRLAGQGQSFSPWVARVAALHKSLLGAAPSRTITVREWSQRVAVDLSLTEIATSIGDPRTIRELDALTEAPEELMLTDLASDTAGTGRVVVSTYHGAKGRTFTAVVLPGLTEGVMPPWGKHYGRPVPLSGAKLDEERRTFYVALTRSRGSVLLQLSSSGQDNGKRPIQRGYSSFALELAASLGWQIG
jgi:hypothetical protein